MDFDVSPKVGVDSKDSDMEDYENAGERPLAADIHGQDVVPEHRVLFRVRLAC